MVDGEARVFFVTCLVAKINPRISQRRLSRPLRALPGCGESELFLLSLENVLRFCAEWAAAELPKR
jgi:hypothetical protein